MKEYFVHIHEELGPLSIEELKKLKITRKTMTWYEGLEEWKHADEIPELQSMFPPKILSASIEDSPQINPNNNINVEPGSLLSSKNEKKNNNFFKIVILGIVIIVLSFIIYSDIQHTKLKAIHKLKIKEEDEKQKQLELEKKIQEEKKAAIDSQLKPEEIIEILGFKNKTIATLTKEERERYNFYLIVGCLRHNHIH